MTFWVVVYDMMMLVIASTTVAGLAHIIGRSFGYDEFDSTVRWLLATPMTAKEPRHPDQVPNRCDSRDGAEIRTLRKQMRKFWRMR